jgi:hypothetical protein
MPSPKRSILRENFIKKQMERQEQSVLLRVTSPPAFVYFWILVLFLLSLLIWSIQVPTFAVGQGMVIEQQATNLSEREVVAALFLPPDQQPNLHVGQSARVSIGPNSVILNSFIEHIETGLISPKEARARFGLQGELAQIITGPSVLVTIPLRPAASAHNYIGSLCRAQVQTGSRRILQFLPGLNQIFKN